MRTVRSSSRLPGGGGGACSRGGMFTGSNTEESHGQTCRCFSLFNGKMWQRREEIILGLEQMELRQILNVLPFFKPHTHMRYLFTVIAVEIQLLF